MKRRPPMSPQEVQQRLRDPDLLITSAPTEATERLEPHVTRIVNAIKKVCGIGSMFITDESALSDFGARNPKDYEAMSKELGITLDLANPDDNMIIKIAYRLARS